MYGIESLISRSMLSKSPVVLLLCIFVCIDIFGLNQLWRENFHRRVLHHLQGSFYNPNKTPWLRVVTKRISPPDLEYINSIKTEKHNCFSKVSPTLSKLVGGNYSNKCTLYYNDFTSTQQQYLDQIGLALKPQLEALCGHRLYLGNSDFRCVLLRYEGEGTEFTCHYDAEPSNCYRTLFLVKAEGTIPPFIHYDESGTPREKHLELGEGIFFQGTRTYHCVGRTNDPIMKRYMIGWQYSTDNRVTDTTLCNMLRSETKLNTIKTLLPHILLPCAFGALVYGFSRTLTDIEVKGILLAAIIASLIVLIPPAKHRWGTGIPFSPKVLGIYIVLCVVSCFHPLYGILYYTYLILTEYVTPRQLIAPKSNNMDSQQKNTRFELRTNHDTFT